MIIHQGKYFYDVVVIYAEYYHVFINFYIFPKQVFYSDLTVCYLCTPL